MYPISLARVVESECDSEFPTTQFADVVSMMLSRMYPTYCIVLYCIGRRCRCLLQIVRTTSHAAMHAHGRYTIAKLTNSIPCDRHTPRISRPSRPNVNLLLHPQIQSNYRRMWNKQRSDDDDPTEILVCYHQEGMVSNSSTTTRQRRHRSNPPSLLLCHTFFNGRNQPSDLFIYFWPCPFNLGGRFGCLLPCNYQNPIPYMYV
jgi:hypothetical protein